MAEWWQDVQDVIALRPSEVCDGWREAMVQLYRSGYKTVASLGDALDSENTEILTGCCAVIDLLVLQQYINRLVDVLAVSSNEDPKFHHALVLAVLSVAIEIGGLPQSHYRRIVDVISERTSVRFRLTALSLAIAFARDIEDQDVLRKAASQCRRIENSQESPLELRISGLRLLGHLPNECGPGPVLMAALADPLPEVRATAALALGRCRCREATAMLARMAAEDTASVYGKEEVRVSDCARRALKGMDRLQDIVY